MKSVTDSYGILHQSAREQSLDLTLVKEVQEDQHVGRSQANTPIFLDPGFATVVQSKASLQHIENDVAQPSVSLEASPASVETSLTTVAVPAVTTVNRSDDADRFVIKQSLCNLYLISCQYLDRNRGIASQDE